MSQAGAAQPETTEIIGELSAGQIGQPRLSDGLSRHTPGHQNRRSTGRGHQLGHQQGRFWGSEDGQHGSLMCQPTGRCLDHANLTR